MRHPIQSQSSVKLAQGLFFPTTDRTPVGAAGKIYQGGNLRRLGFEQALLQPRRRLGDRFPQRVEDLRVTILRGELENLLQSGDHLEGILAHKSQLVPQLVEPPPFAVRQHQARQVIIFSMV